MLGRRSDKGWWCSGEDAWRWQGNWKISSSVCPWNGKEEGRNWVGVSWCMGSHITRPASTTIMIAKIVRVLRRRWKIGVAAGEGRDSLRLGGRRA